MNETTFSYKDRSGQSELYCEDMALASLVSEFGTPLYVYSQSQILKNFRSFKKAIEINGKQNYVSYAVKANSNVEILKLLAAEEAGASVVSGGELRAAIHAGFHSNKITFDGPGKTDEEITLALESNIFAIDVESVQELYVIDEIAGKLGIKARICIRVNPHIDAKTHPYISTGLSGNKFGIPIDNSAEVYQIAHDLPNIEISGIHCHIGSQITDLSVFIEAAESLEQFIYKLREDTGIILKHINFGGGQAANYQNVIKHSSLPPQDEEKKTVFSFEILVNTILPILSRTGCTVNVEPGRSIVANSGVLLTNVLYTKSNGDKRFVIVDAGMSDLIRPSLYHAYHQIVPLLLQTDSTSHTVDIVGPICETTDFLAQDRILPIVRRGDSLAVMCTGAYAYVLASNYNLRPRAAEILVDGSSCRIIREREKTEDIIGY